MIRSSCILFLFALIIKSCAPVYMPTAVNAPLLSKKNEFHGAAYMRNFTGWDIQGAYSPMDHVGLMVNGSKSRTEFLFAPELGQSEQVVLEGGVGFFASLDQQKMTNGELFFGYGRGRTRSKSDFMESIVTTDSRTTGYFDRYFVQASIGVPGGHSGPSFSCRVVKVKYYKFKSEFSVSHASPNAYFAEPALTLKFGPKVFKFVAQGLYAIRISGNKDIVYQKLQLTGGAEIQLGH